MLSSHGVRPRESECTYTMELFIEAVRLHPCLWNPHHPDYRDFGVKDEAWRQVVEEFANKKYISDIQVAKMEWKKLRDNHRDALKRAKLGKNKLLPAHITTWKYAKAMQFLEPHMKYRITEHIETAEPYSYPAQEEKIESYVSTSTIVTSAKQMSVGNPVKRKCVVQNTDVLDSFFNCMLQSTREMPQWMQTQVKRKIFNVIMEAEEVLLSRQPPNSMQIKTHSDDAESEKDYKTVIKTEIMTDDDIN